MGDIGNFKVIFGFLQTDKYLGELVLDIRLLLNGLGFRGWHIHKLPAEAADVQLNKGAHEIETAVSPVDFKG